VSCDNVVTTAASGFANVACRKVGSRVRPR